MTLVQDLHAAISRRDWHAVEVAANRLRDANLEADNAAKDARVGVLEKINANLIGDDEDKPRYTTKRLKLEISRATQALETQLTVMKKALEPFAEAADGRKSKSVTGSVCFTQHYLLSARAALGAKP